MPPHAGEIQENKRNGYGYWMHLPLPAAPLSETLSALRNFGTFTEIPEIVDQLTWSKGVLVKGAPGSGKSHLIEEIQTGCILNNLPAFRLSMHINSGKVTGIENVRPFIEEFQDRVKVTGGGLVILDNLDILGYKGKSRSRTRSTEYAQEALPFVEEILETPYLVVLATAHDEAWREGRWIWQDPAIDEPARAALEAFPAQFAFEGKMALEGLAHILYLRNKARSEGTDSEEITLGQAGQVMKMLEASGKANFFHARHLDVGVFLKDPEEAITQIDHGREVRRGRA